MPVGLNTMLTLASLDRSLTPFGCTVMASQGQDKHYSGHYPAGQPTARSMINSSSDPSILRIYNGQRDRTRPLRDWLLAHRHHPYPTRKDKVALAVLANMRLEQVTMWFANTRRQIRKSGMKVWSGGLFDNKLPRRIGNGGRSSILSFKCGPISASKGCFQRVQERFVIQWACMWISSSRVSWKSLLTQTSLLLLFEPQ